MEQIPLYRVTANSDTTEGRGYSFNVCYTRDHELAMEIVESSTYSNKYGVMGTRGGSHDIRKEIINIVDSVKEFELLINGEARQKALDKLTAEEKKLLGLI